MSASKTVFPGMPVGNPHQAPSFTNNGDNKSNEQNKPVYGFLYSVSKTSNGEFWPLYVGPNTIGRAAACSICLSEATVSDNHATIVIRKMLKNGENNGLFVFIQDTGSTFGTMLNGVTLDINPRECKNGDIITIGENYELYFILVDPDALGLKTKANFKAQEEKQSMAPGWVPQPPVGMNAGDAPKGTQPGTSSSPFDGRKSTIYMPGKK